MTPEMIATWADQWADEALAVGDLPSVQTPDEMNGQVGARLPAMRALSDRLYTAWIANLRR